MPYDPDTAAARLIGARPAELPEWAHEAKVKLAAGYLRDAYAAGRDAGRGDLDAARRAARRFIAEADAVAEGPGGPGGPSTFDDARAALLVALDLEASFCALCGTTGSAGGVWPCLRDDCPNPHLWRDLDDGGAP